MESRENEIINNFSLLTSWEDKYEYLIQLGQEMPVLEKDLKKKKHLISGCQSKVWLVCKEVDHKLYFYADSDALITRGIVAIIVMIYSGLSPKEIRNYKSNVFEKIGLTEHLSMTRLNGLTKMLEQIDGYANKVLKYE